MSGNLVIRPLSGKLTHDTETFGKMDPYVKVCMGTQYKQTAVCQDGGKFPGWKDELSFRHTNEDIISIEVWDKDSASKNDLIGNGSIAFSTITSKGNRLNEWIPLTYKGKKAGEVLFDIQYYPDGSSAKTTTTTTAPTMMPTGYAQPFGGYAQPVYPQQTFQPVYQQPQPVYQQPPTYVQPQPTYQQPTYVQPQTFPQQAYPQQTYPQQTYPQQTYPQQTYPQQGGFPQQGYPQQQQQYPPQQYPPQQGYGYPPHH